MCGPRFTLGCDGLINPAKNIHKIEEVMKSRTRKVIGSCVLVAVIVSVWLLTPSESSFKQSATWQSLASPGALSIAHASLEKSCAACHTSVKGVDTAKCVACHANNESLLGRQPTAFHASMGTCRECHVEHQGRAHRPTQMDHETLARIGLRQLDESESDTEQSATGELLKQWASSGSAPHNHITAIESTLQCATCHSNDDRHFKLFGNNCSDCHATQTWTIPEFRHPSSNSMDCAQCHQAPPSHYMQHFKMISRKVAGKANANVNQCQQCHQTTSWNDILGVGLYKHH